MSPAILGTKVGMTRVYDAKGKLVPVTIIQAGPCFVTQVKTVDSDGYNAVQLGFDEIRPKVSTQALIGHAGKAGVAPQRHFKEFRLKDATDKTLGAEVKVDLFDGVGLVDVVGVSKGKGFAGVMKRHNFGGQPASHGTERKHRSPGSIASRATWRGQSGKPKKGVRMAGHMGSDRVTTQNHAVIKIDTENNLLVIKGPLPGANGSLLLISQSRGDALKKKA